MRGEPGAQILPDLSTLVNFTIRARNIGETGWRFFLIRGLCDDDPARQLVVSRFDTFGAPLSAMWVLPVFDGEDDALVEMAIIDFEGK